MFALNPKGRDWGSVVNWDDLGKLYAIIAVAWTACLLTGTAWLVWHRNLSFIRIRNLPLAITSMVFLHVYLIKILLAYTTNGHFLCSAEYWIMCIYLPLGIALYQAYLSQLRSLWEQQQRLALGSSDGVQDSSRWNAYTRWKKMTRLRKSYVMIAAGLAIQLIVTTVLYIMTPTLQGDWTSYGKVTFAKGQGLCRKSLPWVPSAFWQLFWSWIYGPYTLYEVRHIKDIHMWRAQVLISVIVGLPGTLLWLAALYEPSFKPINKRFVPPMWLAPGIMVIQFVTIFFPIIEAIRSRRDLHHTLRMLDAVEKETGSFVSSSERSTAATSRSTSYEKSLDTRQSTEQKLNTMAALRRALSLNPAPLLEFAATKEFSAENILFLIRVRQWRAQWSAKSASPGEMERLFGFARDIYITLINTKTAEFPINIECKIRSKLDLLFEAAMPTTLTMPPVYNKHEEGVLQEVSILSPVYGAAETNKWASRSTIISVAPLFASHPCVEPLGSAKAIIRPGFDEHIFKEAEQSIEYLVLTNTWQKFVKDKAAKSKHFDV